MAPPEHPPAARRDPRTSRPTVVAPHHRSGGHISGAVLVSVVVHVGLVIFLANALEIPAPFGRLFSAPREVTAERLTYVELPAGSGASPNAAPAVPGGAAATPPEPVPTAAAVAQSRAAPLITPSALPPVGAAPTGGARAGGGATGAAAGLVPAYTDQRVWTRPGTPVLGLPGTTAEQIDSLIALDFNVLRDSAEVEASRRRPGDWTFERNGKKYGIDRQFIRLGKFSLPTAILGLLPLNAQANPIQLERDRRTSQMRIEIQDQGRRRRDEADFRAIVDNIRERKDRERAAARSTTARQEPAGPEGTRDP